MEKQLEHCGQCPELPCQVFISLKDPSITEAEHQKALAERVARLKAI